MCALAVTAAVQNARDASCYSTSSECGRFSHEQTKKTQVSKDMTTPIVSWPFWPASVLNLAILSLSLSCSSIFPWLVYLPLLDSRRSEKMNDDQQRTLILLGGFGALGTVIMILRLVLRKIRYQQFNLSCDGPTGSSSYWAFTDFQIKIANLTKSWATELLHSVIPSLNDNMFCFLY
jgi:hypothetical protein